MRWLLRFCSVVIWLLLVACGQQQTPSSGAQVGSLPSVTPGEISRFPQATVPPATIPPPPTSTLQPTEATAAEVADGALPLLVMADAVW